MRKLRIIIHQWRNRPDTLYRHGQIIFHNPFERQTTILPSFVHVDQRVKYHDPVRGLYELVQMNNELNKRIVNVHCPCLLMQSDNDPIISADSSRILQDGLVNADVTYIEVDSKRHGIVYENVRNTHKRVMRYIQGLSEPAIQQSRLPEEET